MEATHHHPHSPILEQTQKEFIDATNAAKQAIMETEQTVTSIEPGTMEISMALNAAKQVEIALNQSMDDHLQVGTAKAFATPTNIEVASPIGPISVTSVVEEIAKEMAVKSAGNAHAVSHQQQNKFKGSLNILSNAMLKIKASFLK
ncbi:MAG: hypothetical protein ACK4M7_05245 [Burkholderiales bacterium]